MIRCTPAASPRWTRGPRWRPRARTAPAVANVGSTHGSTGIHAVPCAAPEEAPSPAGGRRTAENVLNPTKKGVSRVKRFTLPTQFLQGNTIHFGNFWWAALLLRLPSVPPFPTSHFSFPPWIFHFLQDLPHGSENVQLSVAHVSFPAFHSHFSLCSVHVPLYILMGGT